MLRSRGGSVPTDRRRTCRVCLDDGPSPPVRETLTEVEFFAKWRTSTSRRTKITKISTKKLGSGGFGDVFAAECKRTGIPCAVKIQNYDRNPWCHRELEMQRRVTHPQCTPVLDAYVHGRQLYVVTPKWHIDLYDYLVNEDERDDVDELQAFLIVDQILAGAEACHRAGFAHLDIKPENVMFKAEGTMDVALADFGSSEPFQIADYAETSEAYDPEADDRLVGIDRISGTVLYQSPEIALEAKFSSRSDVWSAGIVLYILITGQPPYTITKGKDDTAFSQGQRPRFGEADLDHEELHDPSSFSPHGLGILLDLMNEDPAERPSASEARKQIRQHVSTLAAQRARRDDARKIC